MAESQIPNFKQAESDTFLARVSKVFMTSEDFDDLKPDSDFVKIYNGNKSFDSKDARLLGCIEFQTAAGYTIEGRAYPFDKNNFTLPIVGESVVIIKFSDQYVYLPYSNTQYPNFREDYGVSTSAEGKNQPETAGAQQSDYNTVNQTGTPNSSVAKGPEDKSKKYPVKEKIKFLKPKTGDTLLTGRVGNTIRFSEFFLTENADTSSPGIFIRNKQKESSDNEKIGTLVEENINEDGSSIYLVADKIKVPFKETVLMSSKKKAFSEYPKEFTGNQIYLNSDRVLISSKINEVIIFSKKSTGIITDAKFNVDANKAIYLYSDTDNITLHCGSNKNIFLNSNGGNVYLGKDKGQGGAGSPVQKMVLGGELVDILEKMLDEIIALTVATSCGPSSPPTNAANFTAIKARVKTILSATNYLSKSK